MSDKVTREDMLQEFDQMTENCREQMDLAGSCQGCLGYYGNKALRCLIEHGPKVSREFVEKWNKRIAESVNVQVITEVGEQSFDYSLVYPGSENLRAMLTEAGVTVKEGKNDQRKD